MLSPRPCLLLAVVLVSVVCSLSEARKPSLQSHKYDDETDDIDFGKEFAGGDERFEETEDQETEEGETEEDGEEEEEDGVEEPGMREGRIQPRTGGIAYGRSPGIAVQSGQTILRGEHQVIHEIEVVLDLGRNLEKNLSSMREVVTKEMEKSRSGREVIQCKRKIARIDDILTQVQTRNDKTETQFRELVKRILSGEIRSKRRCHVLLHGLLSGYRTSLHGLVRNSAGFLRSVVRGVSGALSHLGAGILDIFKLKFAPFEFAINAITNRGQSWTASDDIRFGN